MKIKLESSADDHVWMLLPTFALFYDSETKSVDAGIYFLKYSLNINIKL